MRVILPGGPYFKWPWEKLYKVSIATQTVNMACDPEDPTAIKSGTILEAVTKDQLNTGLTGQIRYRVSERNLYAYLFGVKNPIVHVMGYFVSVLRERIANFEAPPAVLDASGSRSDAAAVAAGISINDLRKNLRDLNEHMDRECRSSAARYGIVLDASLITGHRSAAGSGIGAGRHQHRPQPGFVRHQPGAGFGGPEDRAIETRGGNRNPQGAGRSRAAESLWPTQLTAFESNAAPARSPAYVRNVRLGLFSKAQHVFLEAKQ